VGDVDADDIGRVRVVDRDRVGQDVARLRRRARVVAARGDRLLGVKALAGQLQAGARLTGVAAGLVLIAVMPEHLEAIGVPRLKRVAILVVEAGDVPRDFGVVRLDGLATGTRVRTGPGGCPVLAGRKLVGGVHAAHELACRPYAIEVVDVRDGRPAVLPVARLVIRVVRDVGDVDGGRVQAAGGIRGSEVAQVRVGHVLG